MFDVRSERMRVTFDRRANAAYIYLVPIGRGESARREVTDPGIILDFDRDNRLIGVEVLRAMERLPQQVLHRADRLDDDSSTIVVPSSNPAR